jgi:hypothetical protein
MKVSSQYHAPTTLSRCKNSPWYPLDRRLSWRKNRNRSYGEDKNLAPAWNRTPGVQPIAVLTELFWCLRLTPKKHDFDSSEGVLTLLQQYVVLPPFHHPHFRVFPHLILFRWSQVYNLNIMFSPLKIIPSLVLKSIARQSNLKCGFLLHFMHTAMHLFNFRYYFFQTLFTCWQDISGMI